MKPDDRARISLLHYASFLLAVGPPPTNPAAAGPILGTTMHFASDIGPTGYYAGLLTAKLDTMFTWNLGRPLIPPQLNVSAFYESDYGVYVRHFQHGMVVVNPKSTDAATPLPIQGDLYNPTTNKKVDKLLLPKYSGAILLSAEPDVAVNNV